MAGEEVRERLGKAEGRNEGDRGCSGLNTKFLQREKWKYAPFESDHASDKGVHQDQEGELSPVRPEAMYLDVLLQGRAS
jgi:hypothetical protein